MVHRRDGAVGPTHGEPPPLELIEGLGRSDFVNQVEVDIDDRRVILGLRRDDVPLPQLLEECERLSDRKIRH